MKVLFYINLLGSLQGLILTGLILSKYFKSKIPFLAILAIITFLMSGFAAQTLLTFDNLYVQFPHFIRLFEPFVFAIGPLIYIFTDLYLGKNIKKNKVFLMFIPFIIYFASAIPFYFQSAEFKISHVEKLLQLNNSKLVLISFVRTLFVVAYLLWALYDAKKYIKTLENYVSNIKPFDLPWLRFFLNVFIVVSLLMQVLYLLPIFDIANLLQINTISSGFMAICVYILSYKYLSNPDPIYIDQVNDNLSIKPTIPSTESVALVQSSNEDNIASTQINNDNKNESIKDIRIENLEYIIQILDESLKSKKYYLDSELTLNQLSDKISIPSYKVSKAINEIAGKNFFEFINSYRIEEFKQLISDPQKQNYTIFALALDCGFNSKSSFNTFFKKYTGLTPSQFKNSVTK